MCPFHEETHKYSMHKAVSPFNCVHCHISINIYIYPPLQFTLASKLASEAEAVDVGTVEVYRTFQIRQYQQGELASNILWEINKKDDMFG